MGLQKTTVEQERMLELRQRVLNTTVPCTCYGLAGTDIGSKPYCLLHLL